MTRIVPEVAHNLERKAAVINLGREIASLQTDNVPTGDEHVLLRCSDGILFFFLRVLNVENGNERKKNTSYTYVQTLHQMAYKGHGGTTPRF